VADRNAIATVKLNEQREAMSHMEVVIQDLEVVMTSIKSKRADLRDVQGRLRDQMRLCQEEVGLGGKWGSKSPGSTPNLSNAPLVDTKALRELDAMFSGEIHLSDLSDLTVDEAEPVEETPAPVPTPEVPPVAPTPVVDAGQSEAPALPTGDGTDDDFDAVLSGITPTVEAVGKRPSVSVDDLLNSLLDP
jgi:hypothetical protein